MKVSTTAASKLHKILNGSMNSPEDKKWLQSLSQKSAQDISDEIVKAIIPMGGSIEEESCKNSMKEAIFELLDLNENVNIESLSEDQVLNITESFFVNEICAQVERDLGHQFENLSALDSINMKNEIKDYVEATIGKEFQKGGFSRAPSLKKLNNIYQNKLRDTLDVFEQGV